MCVKLKVCPGCCSLGACAKKDAAARKIQRRWPSGSKNPNFPWQPLKNLAEAAEEDIKACISEFEVLSQDINERVLRKKCFVQLHRCLFLCEEAQFCLGARRCNNQLPSFSPVNVRSKVLSASTVCIHFPSDGHAIYMGLSKCAVQVRDGLQNPQDT